MAKPLSFYRMTSVIRITPDIRRGVFWVDGTNALPSAPKTPEKGVQKFNWEEKLIFALSPEEALQLAECADRILRTHQGKVDFFHDPKKGGREGEVKTLTLSYEKTDKGERVFFQITQGQKRVSCALQRADLFAISSLIPHAVSCMWDWTGTLPPHEEVEATTDQNASLEELEEDIPF